MRASSLLLTGYPCNSLLQRADDRLPPRQRFAVRNGHIKRITDSDIQSSVLEICGANVSTTYVTCPADPKKTLGIKLPFLVMIIKNLKKYFTFEVTVLDDKGTHRRFRASNYQVRARSSKAFRCALQRRDALPRPLPWLYITTH